tara:strand:- start:249 stop:1046 length:798 start_codon:yes stop_codon:yes gene_type:complete
MIYKYLRKKKFESYKNFRFLIAISQFLKGETFKINKDKSIIYILNCGIPRSGSTLLNLFIKELIKLDIDQTETYIDDGNSIRKFQKNRTHYVLLKTHRYFPSVSKYINKGRIVGVMTHRDIRDIVVSLIQKGWCSDFNYFIQRKELRSMVLSSIAYSEMKSMNTFSYKDLKNDPVQILMELSFILKIDLDDGKAKEIAQRLSLGNLKKHTDNISKKRSIDVGSGLHHNHIKDGAIGKWREALSQEKIKIINKEAEEYIKKFAYEL